MIGAVRSRAPRRRWLAGLAVAGVMLATLVPASAAPAAGAPATPAAVHAGGGGRSVAAGANLLRNGNAEVGAATTSGFDAVTIPYWQVAQGLPTVVAYGDPTFLGPSSPGPPDRGRNFFAGGDGGTAILTQTVLLRAGAAAATRWHAGFRLSGWLGGAARHDAAAVRVVFRTAAGTVLGDAQIGPVTPADRHGRAELLERSAAGTLPAGTSDLDVELVLSTASQRYDRWSSVVDDGRGYADDLSLTLTEPVRCTNLPALPAAHVPRFEHVFLVVMENEDYGQIVGNTAQAPYLNSLLRRGSLLADFYAEVHPSDPNYLALSGGSTFGVMRDVLEWDHGYTIDAPNLGDLVQRAGETWKGYAQSENGPCDLRDRGYYYNDDLPFLYYRDIKDNPARCRSHLVPLTDLVGDPADPSQPYDLQHVATTPNLVWFEPNDFYDMEGGGIAAGDLFLRRTLSRIFHSAAWTRQRSLLIVTWDEDGYDTDRPAQHVATIVVGSRDVRAGFISTVRATHYSLLRTIEAALGLGSLTPNDRYAAPLSDVFR